MYNQSPNISPFEWGYGVKYNGIIMELIYSSYYPTFSAEISVFQWLIYQAG